jgi:hypothetical protein
MFDNNIDRSIIEDYASRVSDIISETKPRVIYFSPQDVRKNLLNLRNVRDKDWIESRGKSLSKSKYAVARKLEGFEGWVSMLTERACLSNEILQSYKFPTLVIDTTCGDWEVYYDRITEFLGLERSVEAALNESDLKLLPGRYQLVGSEFVCRIVQENGRLFLLDFFSARCRLLGGEGEFEVQGAASVLKVDRSGAGLVKGMCIDMTRLFEGEIYNFLRL